MTLVPLRIFASAVVFIMPTFLVAQQQVISPAGTPIVEQMIPASSQRASPSPPQQSPLVKQQAASSPSPSSFPLAPHKKALPLGLTARAIVLFDPHTGKIIFQYNENEPRAVASTQKLLTALIIAENGDLDKKVTIEKSDTLVSPTKLGVRTGEVYTRWELLTAMLVKSANDAAVVLARDNAGSVSEFAKKMNHRITELLGNCSLFQNPHGLPAFAQYSTARDMAIVARAAYANPIVRDIVNYRKLNFRFNSGKTVVISNTNHLLRDYSFCNGMKTGFTEKAGHCLIASGNWKGKDIIAVILGERVRPEIWKDGKTLLVYGLGLTPEQVLASRLTKSSSPPKKMNGSSASKPRKTSNRNKRKS